MSNKFAKSDQWLLVRVIEFYLRDSGDENRMGTVRALLNKAKNL